MRSCPETRRDVNVHIPPGHDVSRRCKTPDSSFVWLKRNARTRCPPDGILKRFINIYTKERPHPNHSSNSPLLARRFHPNRLPPVPPPPPSADNESDEQELVCTFSSSVAKALPPVPLWRSSGVPAVYRNVFSNIDDSKSFDIDFDIIPKNRNCSHQHQFFDETTNPNIVQHPYEPDATEGAYKQYW